MVNRPLTTIWATYDAAAHLAEASSGKPIPTPLGAEEARVVVEETPRGRIWATPGTTASRTRSGTM
jgi:hypothetical protein